MNRIQRAAHRWSWVVVSLCVVAILALVVLDGPTPTANAAWPAGLNGAP